MSEIGSANSPWAIMIFGKYKRVGNMVRVACVLDIWTARGSKQWFASQLIEPNVSMDKYIDRHQCIWPNPLAVHPVWFLWIDGLFRSSVLWWGEHQKSNQVTRILCQLCLATLRHTWTQSLILGLLGGFDYSRFLFRFRGYKVCSVAIQQTVCSE
jgi:hypothetical protein